MANISLDFSNNALFQKNKITKTYTYKDIGTDNLRLYTVQQGQGYFKEDKLKVYDKNTFNLDMEAIKSAIRNIFKFRMRTRNIIANVWKSIILIYVLAYK